MIGRFASPDSIIADPGNPQALNRYTYALNNPLKYRDPSGHWLDSIIDAANIAYDIYDVAHNVLNWQNGLSLAADVVCAALPVVTGGGMAVRALAHADDAVDVVRAMDKAGDAADAIRGASAAGAAIQDSSRLLQAPGAFGSKGSVILTEADYMKYGDKWGKNSGRVFVTIQEAGELMKYAPDRAEIGRRLGKEFAGDSPLIRVDIDHLEQYNVRMPTEGNEMWRAGGLTSGGLPERIIDAPVNLYQFPWEYIGQ